MITNAQVQSGVSSIRSRLQVVREHYRTVTIGEWAGLIVAATLPTLAVMFVLDNLLHMPMAVRLVLWLAMAGGMVFLVRRAKRELRLGATDEEIALRVERTYPELNNELINSLLLSKEADEEALSLVKVVVASGSHDADQVDLHRTVPKKRLRLLGGAALAAVVLMGIYALAFPEYFKNAFARVMVPVLPTKPLTLTKIEKVSPGDIDLLSGESLPIAATIAGVIPENVEIGYQMGDTEWQVVRMTGDRKRGEFGYQFRQLTKKTRYYVKARDARSDTFTVSIQDRPVLKDVKARLTYPEYCGLGKAEQTKLNIKALEGTVVDIFVTPSKPLKSAFIEFAGGKPTPMDVTDKNELHTQFTIVSDVSFMIKLVDTFGFENQPVTYTAEALIDQPPSIDVIEPADRTMVSEDAKVTFDFSAGDDFGLSKVAIVQRDEKKQIDTELISWTPDGKFTREFAKRYELPVSELKVEPGATAKVFVRAEDGKEPNHGMGQSNVFSISVAARQEARKMDEDKIHKAESSLKDIIAMQERNLRDTKSLQGQDATAAAWSVDRDPLKRLVSTQEDIRTLTGKTIAILKMDSPVRATLESLYATEMIAAVKQLRDIEHDARSLDLAINTESEILARLTARRSSLAESLGQRKMQDIFTELDAIIAVEKEIYDATEGRIKGKDWNCKAIGARQDGLSDRLAKFMVTLREHAAELSKSDTTMGQRFDTVIGEVGSRQIRENMIKAAGIIDRDAAADALPVEEKVIADLLAIKKMIRDGMAERAGEKLKKLNDLAKQAADRTDKLEKLQEKIKQLSEEMKKANDLSEDDNEAMKNKLEEMEELHNKMAEVLEKMAKDLNVFPEIPACNELVQKMREVYEDVKQAAGSATNQQAGEIAVKRDESILAGLRNLKERIADMEMWLSNAPEATKWKVENFDKAEIPEIPMVDLPEELEDLVGDLLDQEEDVEEESQDSASNSAFGDMPAGWDVADGNMSNFGAKGKSGNQKPNSNELTGRSGGGREGNANGEMVEGKAKDLEGRETKERRTNDPFQKGEVEEENPNSKAKATGGGKQSGQGGEGGLTGTAPPRNELGMRQLERKQMEIKRNTEKIYSQATLLFLPTGELDKSVLLMQQALRALQMGDVQGFKSLQKQITHALANTQRELEGKPLVQLDPSMRLPAEMKEEIYDAKDEKIPAEYEGIVSEYYKAIAGAATE